MSNRPSGKATSNVIDSILAQMAGAERRVLITNMIRKGGGIDVLRAELPSVHLRWGLHQMRTRGWRTDDWGKLLNDDHSLGDGPICLLESIQAPMDAPSSLHAETPEQFYLRLAFVKLGWDVPIYLSNWNDEQASFEPVATLMLKAIELAETDEEEGVQPWERFDELELRALFGITNEAYRAVVEEQKATAT